jgi:hypothetical protein
MAILRRIKRNEPVPAYLDSLPGSSATRGTFCGSHGAVAQHTSSRIS